ncbi:Assembly factor cbp4 [Lithohypha guttulata]|uniref:Cytochrome b mRNA-processing protein 4 n=2 Tax=Lithohypha guttulata TaxID=1690604 RepID=A0AAN7TAG4_9EURO|nr:Assembly factor cbp4 [Lithohypha guttulata]
MSRGGMYTKMAAVFLGFSIGGPAIMYYVTPSEGELFKRFNPELQKRNLELRGEREKNYKDFAQKMIEYSKSDKPIWEAEADARQKLRDDILHRERQERIEKDQRAREMKADFAAGRQALAHHGPSFEELSSGQHQHRDKE